MECAFGSNSELRPLEDTLIVGGVSDRFCFADILRHCICKGPSLDTIKISVGFRNDRTALLAQSLYLPRALLLQVPCLKCLDPVLFGDDFEMCLPALTSSPNGLLRNILCTVGRRQFSIAVGEQVRTKWLKMTASASRDAPPTSCSDAVTKTVSKGPATGTIWNSDGSITDIEVASGDDEPALASDNRVPKPVFCVRNAVGDSFQVELASKWYEKDENALGVTMDQIKQQCVDKLNEIRAASCPYVAAGGPMPTVSAAAGENLLKKLPLPASMVQLMLDLDARPTGQDAPKAPLLFFPPPGVSSGHPPCDRVDICAERIRTALKDAKHQKTIKVCEDELTIIVLGPDQIDRDGALPAKKSDCDRIRELCRSVLHPVEQSAKLLQQRRKTLDWQRNPGSRRSIRSKGPSLYAKFWRVCTVWKHPRPCPPETRTTFWVVALQSIAGRSFGGSFPRVLRSKRRAYWRWRLQTLMMIRICAATSWKQRP